MDDADAVLEVLEGHTWLTTWSVATRLDWPLPRATAALERLRRDDRVERFLVHEAVPDTKRLVCWSWSQAEILHQMAEVREALQMAED